MTEAYSKRLQAMELWQWHHLDHMQIICTLLQTDNHASTSPLSFYRPDALLPPNQQHQSTECKKLELIVKTKIRESSRISVCLCVPAYMSVCTAVRQSKWLTRKSRRNTGSV